jgi:putative transcriptional regulator
MPPYVSGQFLLAMPGMADPRFRACVIAMCTHDPAGAMGLCIHAPMDRLTVPELMVQLEIDPRDTPEVRVLQGGPVEPGRGFVLHSTDYAGQDTRFVGDRWAITGTLDVLRAIAAGSGPARWLVALGYAGWAGGQLEGELQRHGWHLAAGADSLLWQSRAEQRWADAWAQTGIDVSRLGAASGTA